VQYFLQAVRDGHYWQNHCVSKPTFPVTIRRTKNPLQFNLRFLYKCLEILTTCFRGGRALDKDIFLVFKYLLFLFECCLSVLIRNVGCSHKHFLWPAQIRVIMVLIQTWSSKRPHSASYQPFASPAYKFTRPRVFAVNTVKHLVQTLKCAHTHRPWLFRRKQF